MAYIIGLLTSEEMKELERRGWELEEPPQELIDNEAGYDPGHMKMVWVDTSMFDVMNGPDWEKGPGKIELKCEICKKPAAGVASSPMGAISHAYCTECLHEDREVWTTLIGGLIGLEPGETAEWVKPRIQATCKFYNKTEQELWDEVKKFTIEYYEATGATSTEDKNG